MDPYPFLFGSYASVMYHYIIALACDSNRSRSIHCWNSPDSGEASRLADKENNK